MVARILKIPYEKPTFKELETLFTHSNQPWWQEYLNANEKPTIHGIRELPLLEYLRLPIWFVWAFCTKGALGLRPHLQSQFSHGSKTTGVPNEKPTM